MIKEDLIKFEKEIAELYKQGKIHAPIHLSGGNEDDLISLCRHIKPEDWIFSTWRSHYHWLLSGRDPKDLKKQIIEGYSMHVYGDRFFTSAIAGGIAPIALGVAWALKRKGLQNRIWCFLGDMGAMTGIAIESMRYACGHNLPVTFIIEDNGLSVKTDTQEVWGCKLCAKASSCMKLIDKKCTYYRYDRKWPHAGCGIFVLF
jgi:TPP-dependent pyruvate/acetoin dehydrogenase alpha subunit